LGDATGERHPPNVARTKHAPQTLDPAQFGGRLGGRDWRCSYTVGLKLLVTDNF
jgi:hypothetical protein